MDGSGVGDGVSAGGGGGWLKEERRALCFALRDPPQRPGRRQARVVQDENTRSAVLSCLPLPCRTLSLSPSPFLSLSHTLTLSHLHFLSLSLAIRLFPLLPCLTHSLSQNVPEAAIVILLTLTSVMSGE